MTIGKDIPIYQIAITGNEVSEYYSQKSIESFNKFGYYNIERIEATTPENIPSFLNMGPRRKYTSKISREWSQEEIAIWYSHFSAWKKISQPSIIIEHDCILHKNIPDILFKRNLWSFGYTKFDDKSHRNSLAALAYFIKPSGAKKLMKEALAYKGIWFPVDVHIHDYQRKGKDYWYQLGRMSKKNLDSYTCATHYINPDIGTSKPSMGKAKRFKK